MIYKVEGGYVISSNDTWLPGAYDSERAARYAFRFTRAELYALQQSVNPGGCITFEMLQELRRQQRARPSTAAGSPGGGEE